MSGQAAAMTRKEVASICAKIECNGTAKSTAQEPEDKKSTMSKKGVK